MTTDNRKTEDQIHDEIRVINDILKSMHLHVQINPTTEYTQNAWILDIARYLGSAADIALRHISYDSYRIHLINIAAIAALAAIQCDTRPPTYPIQYDPTQQDDNP